MKRVAAIAVGLALLGNANAQPALAGSTPTRSASGQFVIYGASPAAPTPELARLALDTNYIVLDPPLLAVSCERVRERLWRELGVAAPWRGKIYVVLEPARSPDELVTIAMEKFKGGWIYRVTFPGVLERDRYLRALAQVLLLELAGRSGGVRTAEIPAWLIEGFVRELRASGETALILAPPARNPDRLAVHFQDLNERWSNPLGQAWNDLRARPALTFDQLSWPVEGQLDGPAGALYRSSAQLFLNRLLRLENGRACLRAMIETLPQYYNWQIAFQNAFRPHFHSLLDVEKWWALQVVQFTGRDLTETWTPAESWNKFEEILRSRVEVRASENDLPLHAEVSLQTIVREWERARQVEALQRKLNDLNLARLRVVPDLVPLLDDYRAVIQNFLQRRNESVVTMTFKKRQARILDRLAEEAIRQLDALDAVRAALRPVAPPPASADGSERNH